MKQDSPLVMVMIPTFNERENLEELATQILALPLKLCITIVDDHSPDGTGEIADQLAARDARVRVVHRMGARGRASAGIAGFKAALECEEAGLIVEMDADFSHDPQDIIRLVEKAQGYDVVIGSRYVEGGAALNCTPRNVMFSRIINAANRALFRLPVRDSSGGYKCYRRRVLETINLNNYTATEFSVGLETLVKCKNNGFTMVEIPIIFRNRERGHSKVNMHVLTEYPLSLSRLVLKSLHGEIK